MMEGRIEGRNEWRQEGRKGKGRRNKNEWVSSYVSDYIRSARNITFKFVFSQPNVDFGPQFTGLKTNLPSYCWNIPHPLLQSCVNHWDSLRLSTIIAPRLWGGSADLQSPIHTGTLSVAAKSPQLCPILCDPIDRSPPSSPVPGILKARTLEWVAISFSNA